MIIYKMFKTIRQNFKYFNIFLNNFFFSVLYNYLIIYINS